MFDKSSAVTASAGAQVGVIWDATRARSEQCNTCFEKNGRLPVHLGLDYACTMINVECDAGWPKVARATPHPAKVTARMHPSLTGRKVPHDPLESYTLPDHSLRGWHAHEAGLQSYDELMTFVNS